MARVRPGGSWDDKAGKQRLDEFERQGNFSFGATAAALGLPLDVALRGAGAAQRMGAVNDVLQGRNPRPAVGGLRAPYGDDPRDQPAIVEGYGYGQKVTRRNVRSR